ncbi:hypothetical protein HBB16_21025 [Pseudonocardia sp. MCCB 268]|nr:hypothetical protein [Pseudonocardia cytotoxica]
MSIIDIGAELRRQSYATPRRNAAAMSATECSAPAEERYRDRVIFRADPQ